MRTELYWIEGPWRGRLAIMPRPRGGDWLADEISSWKRTGIDAVVSALTIEESAELELDREKELCDQAGIELIPFPIADRSTPSSAIAVLDLVRHLERRLTTGVTLAIHCRQGVGRAALLAACVLVVGGVNPSTAFERIAAARGCAVPDTSEQREWVVRFARDTLATAVGRVTSANTHAGGEP
jgi:protein-tyrosine phosphatase